MSGIRRSATVRRTSREALDSMQEHLQRCQAAVLYAIKKRGPLCDEDIAALTGLSPNCARPRRLELVNRGLLRDSGKRVLTSSGRRAIAWAVVR